ncbi:uncharacterized protein N7473_010670, partial [Penicillium subrubescens]|uniref:uncharacterized protein n=1 Tax=Penicillium subrubescens TaxID=1316194 RepID=UPI0025455AB9
TVAITPFRFGNFEFDEVERVCQICTLSGLRAMYEAQEGRPFRFLYLSAEGTPDDPMKKPMFMGGYQIMRVTQHRTASTRAFRQAHKFRDLYRSSRCGRKLHNLGKSCSGFYVAIDQSFLAVHSERGTKLAAAILSQVLHGFSGEILSSADLVRIGQKALRAKET